jgi:hypothetical protein
VRLLPFLTAHLNPMRRRQAAELETALAEAFTAAGCRGWRGRAT